MLAQPSSSGLCVQEHGSPEKPQLSSASSKLFHLNHSCCPQPHGVRPERGTFHRLVCAVNVPPAKQCPLVFERNSMTSLGASNGQQAVVKTWEGKRERHISARLNYQLPTLGGGKWPEHGRKGKLLGCRALLSPWGQDESRGGTTEVLIVNMSRCFIAQTDVFLSKKRRN